MNSIPLNPRPTRRATHRSDVQCRPRTARSLTLISRKDNAMVTIVGVEQARFEWECVALAISVETDHGAAVYGLSGAAATGFTIYGDRVGDWNWAGAGEAKGRVKKVRGARICIVGY